MKALGLLALKQFLAATTFVSVLIAATTSDNQLRIIMIPLGALTMSTYVTVEHSDR